MTDNIEKFFCNRCKNETRHFIHREFCKTEDYVDAPVWMSLRVLIVECCGCENLAFVKMEHFSEDHDQDWDQTIFPPVAYRPLPDWFEDLPDETIKLIFEEIYKSLQTESYYLATFGSRTLIDRLIVLTVGDVGNFAKGFKALQDRQMLSQHERDILQPVVDAGHAAAHRGWAPGKALMSIILDTVEGLVHRLLVLPKLTEELKEAVPGRSGAAKKSLPKNILTIKDKIGVAPPDLKIVFDYLEAKFKEFGDDVTTHPQKHYLAFRRNRNFASVQIYNVKKMLRVYLNLDPETVPCDAKGMRDVRKIGHYGTGNLEIEIRSKQDVDRFMPFMHQSYLDS